MLVVNFRSTQSIVALARSVTKTVGGGSAACDVVDELMRARNLQLMKEQSKVMLLTSLVFPVQKVGPRMIHVCASASSYM